MSIEGKTLLVTGANRGIGQALVTEALARGAKQVYCGTRKPLDHSDERVTPVTLDITDPAQIQGAASQIESLDILINNAGIMLPDVPFDPSVLDRHMAVNFHGTNAVTQAFLPALVNSGGAVITMMSVVALAPLPPFPSYSISKAASYSLTKTLRAFYGPRGVKFHAVLAGPIDTDMVRELQVPKATPQSAAQAIFDAVAKGEEDIFPDATVAPLAELYANSPDKILEQQFAALVQEAPASS
ncbi:SDR family NAD(P)-dependent oxidoreductase [Nonomuraea sp. NPDC004580]|uniref:SDR family NAD(P)-dependent oxidoreductase n=1 Tax=Nonomuraea sp. NPDC004580 TaxID=3154552 RepID=UPI0033AAE0A8